MKIAYLVLAHTDSKHIKRLSKILTVGNNNKVFIHLDKKINLNEFQKECPEEDRISYIKNRVKVYWAGFSSIEATINSFKEILESKEFDRIVILQGLDYPIKSNEYINEFFEKNKDIEFIKAFNETENKDIKNLHKYCFFWYLDKDNFFKKLINKVNTILLKMKILIKFKKPYIIIDNKKYELYRGWAHISLTKEAVKYIVEFHENNDKFNKYFKTVYASDESYFHTIIYNSPFRKKTSTKGLAISENNRNNFEILNLTYFEYPDIVKVFTKIDDYLKLKKSKFLYIRKVNSGSKDLLDYIDKDLQENN